MRSKFKWIFTLLVAFTMQFSFAQEKTVTGVVSDAIGPLAGANVVVQGTTNGTTTDFDGKYSIKAKQGDVLEISYTGMKNTTVTVGSSNVVDVTMQEDVIKGTEVVVVGYGTTTKEAYVGTATKVNQESVEAKSVSNISQALKGEVAGVNVITTSGQPGSNAAIRIRGFGSINGNRDPLYVVDGVPYQSDLSSINPSDIASMTILKDATATAVYGSRGANGVVVITTKSGSLNKSSVEVDLKTGFNMDLLPRYDVISSPEEYIELSWNAMYNRGVSSGALYPAAYANDNLFSGQGISPAYNMWNVSNVDELIDPSTGKVRDGVTRKYNPENWRDYAFQASYRQQTDVRFSGGNEKTKYFSSFGFLDDEGYIVNSNYRRYSTRLNLTHEVASWLKAGANIGYAASRYTQNGQSDDSGSVFWFSDNIPSIYPLFLRDSNGDMVADPYFGGYQYDYGAGDTAQRGFGGLTNAIADAHYDLNRSYSHDFNGNFNFDFKLHKNVGFQVRYGGQLYMDDSYQRNNPFYGSSAQQFGSLFKTVTSLRNQNFLQMLTYKKTFGDNHNFDAFVAHESTDWKRDIFSTGKQGAIRTNTLALDQYLLVVGQPSSYIDQYSLESYFGQLNYNFANKYYFTGSLRRDGSSRFKNNKWGTFGSIGASWILSKESFLEGSDFVNFLKLKGSYGIIGDQGNELYYGYQFYTAGPLNDTYSLTLNAGTEWDENITWEESKIAQVGLEATLFNNRVDVAVDYYVKNTDNLFVRRSEASSTGTSQKWVNDGQLRNSGIEFDVLGHIIRANDPGDFKLDFGINGEILDNEITKMPLFADGTQRILDPDTAPGYGYAKGHSIYDFYMREWAGVNPANGAPLWNMYYDDMNGDGVYNTGDVIINSYTTYLHDNPDANVQKTTTSAYSDATQKFVGKSAIPKVRGAFRFNAAYKNFDLSAQFTYSYGGYSYDSVYAGLMGNGQVGSNNWHADMRDRWQQPGDITNVPRLSSAYGNETAVNSRSTRFLTKSDYLGLNNARLGYSLPSKFTDKLRLSKLNLFVSGDNLMFLSKRKGFNPSTSESGGSNTYRYSPLSTFTMGVKVEF